MLAHVTAPKVPFSNSENATLVDPPPAVCTASVPPETLECLMSSAPFPWFVAPRSDALRKLSFTYRDPVCDARPAMPVSPNPVSNESLTVTVAPSDAQTPLMP